MVNTPKLPIDNIVKCVTETCCIDSKQMQDSDVYLTCSIFDQKRHWY